MVNATNKRLVFVELNEVNFDVVAKYIEVNPGKYRYLEQLMCGKHVRTTSEQKYEEIESWIQWVSVHTGLSYNEHRVFRLGDIVGSKNRQFFEKLEEHGIRVGSISAMNAENRLRNPAFFIPDPWTETPSDGSWWSRALGEAVSQTVNDNAQSKITVKSAIILVLGMLRFAKLNIMDYT